MAYTLWDRYASPAESRSVRDDIKIFAPAFFFLMWLAGQFLRVRKQMHDEEAFGGVLEELRDLRRVVEGLHVRPAEPPPTQADPSLRDAVTRALVREAGVALDAGLTTSALLTLAVAFEHAVRDAARADGVADADRTPIPRILKLLAVRLGDDAARMEPLWRARHMLVHRHEPLDLSDADTLAHGYRWAIRRLDEAARSRDAA